MLKAKTTISRRQTLLAICGAASAGSMVPFSDAIAADAEEIARRMARRHGGRWKAVVDHEAGFILIKPRRDRAQPLLS